jgi:hypothetical protein
MAGYAGDIRLGDTIDIKFTTVQSTGAPTTLAGTPSVACYPGNSTTEITAGITLTVDFDSRTGYHNVRVVASGGNGYATATNYSVAITAGTVNAVSVVGYEVGSFSIENRSALMPTTAALTLDVSATGEAGVDWGNVGSKTTVNALTNTSIITTQKVDVETIKTNPVVNGGTITFPTTATLASTTNITAGTITTATNVTTVNGLAAGVITATSIAADAITDAKVAADVTIASVTGAVGSVTGAVGSVTGAVGSVTGNVGGNVTGSIGSLAAQAKTDVNDQVLDVINVDTYAEPAQGAPAATISLAAKLNFLYKSWRNKKDNDGTTTHFYDDAGTTVDHKRGVAEAAGTVTEGKVLTGP